MYVLYILIISLFIGCETVSSQKDGFDKNCLDSHNEYREKHAAPPLVWSDSLAAAAQKWADTLAKRDEFKHDMDTIEKENQGENLAYFVPPRSKCMGERKRDCVQCAEMVADWYNEVKDYDFQTGKAKTAGGVVLHFTQVVWKATKELGVGTAISTRYGFITVARYSPRGNMGSPPEYKKNVQPGGSAQTTTRPSATRATQGTSATPGTSTVPTSSTKSPAKTTQGSAQTTTRPSATRATQGTSATPGTSTVPTSSTKSPAKTTQGSTTASTTTKTPGEDCEFFIITTVTKERKIIQKCKGKPNATFIQQTVSVSTSKPFPPTTGQQTTTRPATTAATTAATTPASSSEASTTKNQPTTIPATSPPPASSPTPTQPSSTTGSSVQPKETSAFPTASSNPTSQPTSAASTTSTEQAGTTKPSEGQQDKALMLINVYRTMHGAHPLIETTQLTDEAQKWAEHLAQAEQLIHDKSTSDGENIAAVKANSKDIENVINTWFDEEKLYDYTAPAFSKSTGHFTQLVWKLSQEFGVGIAPSKDKSRYYVVARFRPSGNIQNKFADNVGLKVVR